MRYAVIVRMNGEVMGSKTGIPCNSLEQAKDLADKYRKRGKEFEMTEVLMYSE